MAKGHLDELQKAEKYPIMWSLQTGFTVLWTVGMWSEKDSAIGLYKGLVLVDAKALSFPSATLIGHMWPQQYMYFSVLMR